MREEKFANVPYTNVNKITILFLVENGYSLNWTLTYEAQGLFFQVFLQVKRL